MNWIILISAIVLSTALVACEKKPATPPSGEGTNSGAAPAKPEAVKPDAVKPNAAPNKPEVIELGETTQDGMKVKASRDKGEIKAGGDAPIDIWIDGGLGNAAGVRFWIGIEDAKGSIKAKAGVEDGHWNTHGEVPDPLPADSRLWVEIEGKNGKKSFVSFDLKK